ncbi:MULTISPECIES: DNA polymerase I [unclassified Coleofasciculus]|uniref:DNA polymerase I n=1 Tax=unclassified Coleofasciculus TaxID=2692782 RepID=UPI00187F1027|nr:MULTISPECIES: DNA polymerase I [unclassified Coleofasciculus]MBE9127802.1 DNA polymerase I [Coleofasciculus sp. LEGE 07081]MBE9150043.1 DNA polymerase I [Coleofasciculus sp. LEGE 07092]
MSKSTPIPNPAPTADASWAAPPLLILIDGHSLAFRSYFAFAKGRDGGLRTTTGTPTSVCFGFLKSLLEIMSSEQPQSIAVAFDLGLPTFRHEADDTYKADRPDTPEDFIPDLKNLQELLQAFNLPVLTSPGYEADDVLATLAKQGSEKGYQVKILTGDRDLFQLVDPEKQISVLYFSKDFLKGGRSNPPTEIGTEQVKEKLGITPEQVVDYKALCGDKSDNIPGVNGIGDKTAVSLLNEYGSLEGIYASLDQVKGAVKKRLEAGKEAAEHSRYLAQLKYDAPVEFTLEDARLEGFDTSVLKPLLEKLEFQSFLGKIDQLQQSFGGKTVEEPSTPLSSESVETKPIALEDNDLWFWSAEETEAYQEQISPPAEMQLCIINTPEKLTELVKQLQECTNPDIPVAWDTETSDLEPRDAQLVGIGCSFASPNPPMVKGGTEEKENGESQSSEVQVAYIPINHTDGGNLDKDTVLDALRPILESDRYPKALQNVKFDRLVLRCQGIQLKGVVFDTMLASYVLNPDNSHNLNDLAERYLQGIKPKSYKDLNIPKGKTIADLGVQTVADYCGLDAYATFQLVPKLRQELEKVPKLHELLLNVEQPLEPVLAEMEYRGIRIDTDYLKELSVSLENQLETIEQDAYQIAGEQFNLGSPKQLSELLSKTLGSLFHKKSRKTKTGYSTDHATLEKLQGDHPVIDKILDYRTLSKLKSTYVDALPALVRPDTQRVHTDFNQTITSTGRLSSSNPNLQNIPIRTAFSRQIRKAFLPESGWLLVSADYSQIELRILADLSKEPILIETYQNNEDVHAVTAKLLFEKEEVTPDERRLGKTINFGVIYGMGAQRFAREAGVSATEGKIFIERFNQRYSKVFEYLETKKQEAIAQGYVETILKRRRYFNFNSSRLRSYKGKNPQDIYLDKLKGLDQYDAALLRAAANAPIQGSSADIIKIAMVNVQKLLQGYQARLLLQVHDELVFEVPPQEWEELQPQIRETMESAVELSVPLVVDVNAGDNWMETK